MEKFNCDFIATGHYAKLEDGKLYRKYNSNHKIISIEYLYMHLQKRKMQMLSQIETDNYLIVPNKFIFLNNNEEFANEMINLYTRKKYFLNNVFWKCNRVIKKVFKVLKNLFYSLINKHQV